MIYPSSLNLLDEDLKSAPETEITALARRLMDGAKAFDLHKASNLGVSPKFSHIARNADAPPDYTHDSVLRAPWADDAHDVLAPGECWNAGRRATNTGLAYCFNQNGHPLNPYMNTGLTGRGVLGQFGPNHAVDNGVLVVDQEGGKTALFVLGILRKYDNNAPAFSGGFVKHKKNDDGAYDLDHDSTLDNQTEEFFEEMVSGSIRLLPEYDHKSLTNESESDEETVTALKLQQVRDKDPEFLGRLRQTIASGRECFAGPVLNDCRNTNNAWIETRLSWFLMDDTTWNYIKGPAPVFDYKFRAGDDASGVVYHRFDRTFIQTAYASHGAMAAFMAASFLLEEQRRERQVCASIREQIDDVAAFLEPFLATSPGAFLTDNRTNSTENLGTPAPDIR